MKVKTSVPSREKVFESNIQNICYTLINLINTTNQIEKLVKNTLSGTSWKDPEYNRMSKDYLKEHQ